MIPRIIIQTGRDLSSLKPIGKGSRATLAALHPDFHCMLLSDEDIARFVDEKAPEYKALVESFPVKIQRLDFFRYLALLHYGAFYFTWRSFRLGHSPPCCITRAAGVGRHELVTFGGPG